MRKQYDYCILGAGLAGLSVAKSLIKHGDCSILIIDPKGIAGGASGSPIGLVNPATGRYATKSWKAEEAIHIIKRNFEEVELSTGKYFYKNSGVIRPAMEQKIASRMQENLINTDWPENWCYWLGKHEMSIKFPDLENTEGGLLVNSGMTVSIPDYLNALAEHLKEDDVDIIEYLDYDLEYNDQNWRITFSDSLESIKADQLIVTAGIKSKEFDFLEDLPLIPVKGQVVTFKCEYQFPYDTAVSALGYFASMDGKTFVAGSTYEHKFQTEKPDDFGIEYISNRLFRVIPKLKGKVKLIDQWSGVRASTPDRMPIVGYHPNFENCIVFAGLGSKGLLYSAYIGEKIGLYLSKNNEVLPEEISINRFL